MRNKIICASVFQSHSEKQGILLKTKLLGQSKLLDATWYHPRGPFVKRSPLISRVFQLGEIFIRFAPRHKRSCFQSHKSIKKSGQNWGERLRTYFCGLLYYDLPWFATSWFPFVASDTSVRKFPPVTRPLKAHQSTPLYPCSGLAWLAQQPTGASCAMLEAKSNPMMRERFDDTSDLSGSHCWRIPIPSRSQEQHPWRP